MESKNILYNFLIFPWKKGFGDENEMSDPTLGPKIGHISAAGTLTSTLLKL